MSKVTDLIPIDEARRRIKKARSYVVQFARATGTLHKPTNKIVWPEFEKAFMDQRDKAEQARQAVRRARPTSQEPEKHPLVTC